jgi:hypothetical protein
MEPKWKITLLLLIALELYIEVTTSEAATDESTNDYRGARTLETRRHASRQRCLQ